MTQIRCLEECLVPSKHVEILDGDDGDDCEDLGIIS